MLKTTLLPVFSALLLLLSFLVPSLWSLSLVALTPLLIILYESRALLPLPSRIRRAFFVGLWFGFLFLGVVLAWFFETLPLTWLGIESGWAGFSIVFFYWSTVTLTLSIFSGLFAVGTVLLARNSFFDLLLLPSLWIFAEFARAFGFSLLTLAPGSLPGPHFSAGFIGYTLANSPLLPGLASAGGIYLLGFVVVFVNTLLFLILRKGELFHSRAQLFTLATGVVAVAVSLTLLPYLTFSPSTTQETAALVHTDFAPMFFTPLAEELRRTFIIEELVAQAALSEKPLSYFVLPEDSRFLPKLIEENRADLFFSVFKEPRPIVFDSGRVRTQTSDYYRLFVYDAEHSMLATREKVFLAPQGEYTPIFYTWFLKLIRGENILARIETRGASKSPETKPKSVFKTGALFCSEVLTPALYRELAVGGAEIFINVASHSWFHGSRLLALQVEQMAKVHAASHDRYYLQASNTAPSFVLDNFGRTITKSEWSAAEVIVAPVERRTTSTPYTRFGDWPIVLASFIIAFSLVRSNIRYS